MRALILLVFISLFVSVRSQNHDIEIKYFADGIHISTIELSDEKKSVVRMMCNDLCEKCSNILSLSRNKDIYISSELVDKEQLYIEISGDFGVFDLREHKDLFKIKSIMFPFLVPVPKNGKLVPMSNIEPVLKATNPEGLSVYVNAKTFHIDGENIFEAMGGYKAKSTFINYPYVSDSLKLKGKKSIVRIWESGRVKSIGKVETETLEPFLNRYLDSIQVSPVYDIRYGSEDLNYYGIKEISRHHGGGCMELFFDIPQDSTGLQGFLLPFTPAEKSYGMFNDKQLCLPVYSFITHGDDYPWNFYTADSFRNDILKHLQPCLSEELYEWFSRMKSVPH